MNRKTFLLFIRLSRPHFLLGAALMYALGTSISRYLSGPIHWGYYLQGQVWITLIQLSAIYLTEFFDPAPDQENSHRTIFSASSGTLGEGKLKRETALYAAIICLALAAYFTLTIIQSAKPDMVLAFTMSFIFLGAFAYSTPPLRLAVSGYGELILAIILSNLVPALGFLIQHQDLHRLLAMSTFPMAALSLAMLLAFELPDFASDVKYRKRNLMVRVGWQKGMLIHNISILFTYLLFGLGVLLGFPFPIVLPAFLTLPLGLFQIWMVNRIADGARPNWPALTFTAAALFSITAYLLTFAFWTR
jgi:1,4-dihydroxy-2-naphthoate polyprenyltransferase